MLAPDSVSVLGPFFTSVTAPPKPLLAMTLLIVAVLLAYTNSSAALAVVPAVSELPEIVLAAPFSSRPPVPMVSAPLRLMVETAVTRNELMVRALTPDTLPPTVMLSAVPPDVRAFPE